VTSITRAELVERLARLSHETWMLHANRDKHIAWEELPPDVHPHDRERAEATVTELERLGVLRLED
jgi:hypothetical protein